MTFVCVRCSQKPTKPQFGFSKGKLEHITETVGIKYVNIPDLGMNLTNASSLETVEDYKACSERLCRDASEPCALLERVYSLLCTNVRIA
jgi:uncharacterized protein (DUF488 family)